jgi:hypothetical protein
MGPGRRDCTGFTAIDAVMTSASLLPAGCVCGVAVLATALGVVCLAAALAIYISGLAVARPRASRHRSGGGAGSCLASSSATQAGTMLPLSLSNIGLWPATSGPPDAFLDLDRIGAGERWKEALLNISFLRIARSRRLPWSGVPDQAARPSEQVPSPATAATKRGRRRQHVEDPVGALASPRRSRAARACSARESAPPLLSGRAR